MMRRPINRFADLDLPTADQSCSRSFIFIRLIIRIRAAPYFSYPNAKKKRSFWLVIAPTSPVCEQFSIFRSAHVPKPHTQGPASTSAPSRCDDPLINLFLKQENTKQSFEQNNRAKMVVKNANNTSSDAYVNTSSSFKSVDSSSNNDANLASVVQKYDKFLSSFDGSADVASNTEGLMDELFDPDFVIVADGEERDLEFFKYTILGLKTAQHRTRDVGYAQSPSGDSLRAHANG